MALLWTKFISCSIITLERVAKGSDNLLSHLIVYLSAGSNDIPDPKGPRTRRRIQWKLNMKKKAEEEAE
jgi:hypothetical protein